MPSSGFDLSYSYQVFEHLPSPRPYLEQILRVTRPGGLVVIHTDMHVPERQGRLSDWWYVMPPDHCSFYRHRTFEVVLRDTPHRVAWRDAKSIMLQIGA